MSKLTLKKSIIILDKHNQWRRGDDSIEMINPVTLGNAIDLIVKNFKKIIPLNKNKPKKQKTLQ